MEMCESNRKFHHEIAPVDRASRLNISKHKTALREKLEKLGLSDLYRAFHLQKAGYTLFYRAHGIVSKTDHILGPKFNLPNS